MASAGDVDGDGIGDFLVSAPGLNATQGRTYLFYGSASIPSTLDASDADATIDGAANEYLGG